MAKPTRRRLKPSTAITLQDCLEGMLEIFERSPTTARDFREIAQKRGVSFELVVYEAIARGCHRDRQPLPPEVREYLMQHATQINPKLRAKLLKPIAN
jgi:hypothetical protein